jgi:anaerobic selenocysteine-containing dehydrogenase
VTHFSTCPLCEAACGIAFEVDGKGVTSIRGDADDPFSRGYICPKAAALADLHDDPDRLCRPMIRSGGEWRETSWDDAFDRVIQALEQTRQSHGPDAIAVYQGNPTAHSLGLMTFGQVLLRNLGTKNLYSASSADQLPHMVAAHHMFGDGLLMPVPDLDRADFFLCIGANPLVSNGSIMTAPNMRARLQAIRSRGGRVVVVDPRRTETADAADEHLFIHPGTDALFLMSILQVIFGERLGRPGRLESFTDGIGALEAAANEFSPETTAAATGIAPAQVRGLARAFAVARGAAYGRIGLCTQEFGAVASWLLYALNLVCGRLDEPGGMMFTTPALDVERLAKAIRMTAGFDRWRSRVRKLPEYGGELPVATLADEIETPGPGQIRALIVSAGNPVLSTPDGGRLDRLLPALDFIVAIDPYLNETTRHADVILPPTSPLERSHYDVALFGYAVRNVAKFSPPVFERPAEARHDWEICLELWTRLGLPGVPLGPLGKPAGRVVRSALKRIGPEGLLDIGLRAGPYGIRRLRQGLTLRQLRGAPHGIDLGPLTPRFPERLRTRGRRIDAAPQRFLDDIGRLRARMAAPANGLVLIGRRHLHSNNSWCHNAGRLVKGPARCVLLINPRDAAARGISDGDLVALSSRTGQIEVTAHTTDDIMNGVVSLPHGWGHNREGVQLRVARHTPGASVNDITDGELIDAVSGNAGFSGLPVAVEQVTHSRPVGES